MPVETDIGPAAHLVPLAQCRFFDALSPDELTVIAQMARFRKYKPGQMVFSQGEPVEAFYLVVLGKVQAYKIGADGKEVILHLVSAGDVFAEHPVFGGMVAYPAYAQCIEPTELLAIPTGAFKAFVSNKPDILMKMLARFSQRIIEFSHLIEDLSLRSVDERLAKYLLTTTAPEPQKTTMAIQKKTLAAILGTIPETLSRAFKRLKDQGAIQLDNNTLTILDRDLLTQLANVD
jgi:CRP-like cAMP-binding protein